VTTYSAILDIPRNTIAYLANLLLRRRQTLGTRAGRRALSVGKQAVLILRWFLDNTRLSQLRRDNDISKSTAYSYLHEGIDVLAAQAPDLHTALEAAKQAGHTHLNIDGTLIYTDRSSTPGPTPGVDLWWSGKHHHHGGNIQILSTPDGHPIWTSGVRPGREHDTTAARTHAGLLPALAKAKADGLPTLSDLGYEGEADTVRIPVKTPPGGALTDDQKTYNRLHAAIRSQAERANAQLKMRFKALRRVSLCPWRIGHIIAAALVLFHHENGRKA
jgi:DDE superfamily endonuclease